MYLPRHFEEEDRERIVDLIRDYPFATVVSVNEGSPVINHFPLIIDPERTDRMILLGHMSTKNPHSLLLAEGDTVTALFHGPHTYVTPKWYAQNDVPTWNYAVVHASGRIRWIREFKLLIQALRKMTSAFESGATDSWRFTLPDDLKSETELTGAIVGFEIEVDSIEAKFKMSQNRSEADRNGVIRGLAQRQDEMSQKVMKAMLRK